MELKNKIQKLKSKGISYTFIAKQANVHKSTIARYMRNDLNLSSEREQVIELVVNQILGGVN